MMNPDKLQLNKLLVVRLSSMGDIILTTSLIRQLHSTYPNTEIDFVVSSQFIEIYKYNPYISNLIIYNKTNDMPKLAEQKKELIKSIPGGKYDIIVDLQRNLRSLIFCYGLGKKYIHIKKPRLNKLSLVFLKKTTLKEIVPIPELYRLTLVTYGVKDDGKGLELWLPEEKGLCQYPPENKVIKKKEKYKIAIAPGAHHATKRWGTDKYAELISRLNNEYHTEIVILGGVKDKEISEEIQRISQIECTDYSGSSSIIETARHLGSCDLLITNDTGVMHIAAARKVPVVAIFGSTVKEFGFAPYRTPNIIVEKDLPCRPCTHIGRQNCPKRHFDCMNKIMVEEVLSAAKEMLNIE